MKKFSKLLLVVLVMLGLQACATGADVGQQGTGTANVATGDVDVGIDQSFTVTFSAAVDPDTVTTDSFFVVPVSDPEPTLIKLAIFEAGVCDPDHAIDATVTCATNTECTLTPTGVLDPAAEYAICLTPAIRFADENMYGYFDGLTETFVTEASPAEPEPAPDATYTVGGTMTGVLNPAVLQNNDGDDLTVEEDGAFVFATQLEDGASYSVTVATPPGEMNCTIENGTGTIAGANVTNVVITCVDMEVTDIPVMEPAGGAYDAVQEVTITSTTEGATIYYTADGSYPSTSSTVYTGPVEIGEGETVLKAIVRKAGMVGNVAASETYVITLEEPEAVKKIFVTDATYNGNLGGVAGADALCEADANKPATGTYKALIVDGVARVACTTANCGGGAGENIDWVL
ncbi:MAG TPA: DUF1554 domain-containing protein, partial [bacterium]|nr:DUF1554 domain-containing protein [bacterium]